MTKGTTQQKNGGCGAMACDAGLIAPVGIVHSVGIIRRSLPCFLS